jgi:hypothetical protein
LKVSENSVLRKIFIPKRDEVDGGRRKLHNEKFHNLFVGPLFTKHCWDMSRTMELVMSKMCNILVKKP